MYESYMKSSFINTNFNHFRTKVEHLDLSQSGEQALHACFRLWR